MSDTPLGPYWWQASDGKWYSAHLHPWLGAPQPLQPAAGGPHEGPTAADITAHLAVLRPRHVTWAGVGAVGVVLAILATLITVATAAAPRVAVSTTGTTGRGGGAAPTTVAPRQPAPAELVRLVTGIPVATYSKAAPPDCSGGTRCASTRRTCRADLRSRRRARACRLSSSSALNTARTCAVEDWSLVLALSKFGTFRNLQTTTTAVNDGDIPTFTFYGTTYTSPSFTFDTTEMFTDQPSPGGSTYQPLQSMPGWVQDL